MPKAFGPEHWMSRAEEARTMAESLSDPAAKRAMLDIAKSYEMLAKRAEAKAAGVELPRSGRLTRDDNDGNNA
jgi:hypothetical protein